jgi:endonuclease YncB( thermonuclease family)
MKFCIALLTLLVVCGSATSEPIQPSEITVVDGDTIKARGHRWRMVGYDTPEIRNRWRKVSRAERELGMCAKQRFKELLKSGPLDLSEVQCSCPIKMLGTKICNYGRKCGLLTLNGENIGEKLINESLAERFECEATKCPAMPKWEEIIQNSSRSPCP